MSQYEFSVSVETRYLPDQSDPDSRQYAFAYTLTIRNTGQVAAQLISRHWVIENARGHREEVKGLGVVGKQPLLRPGESFQYTSGTPLPTPTGIMAGSYQMVTDRGERFDVTIPAFSLDAPGVRRAVN